MRKLLIFLLYIIISFNTLENLYAQSTNTEETVLVDKIANWADSLLEMLSFEHSKYFVTIYPTAGFSRRTGVEFGVMPILGWYNKKENKVLNTLSFMAQLSTKSMIEIRASGELYSANGWRISSNLEYVKVNDKFWGIYSNQEDELRLISERYRGNFELYKLIKKNWYLGVDGVVGHWINSQWEEQPNKEIIGILGGTSIGIGPIIMNDTRDDYTFPSRGIYFKTSYKYFLDRLNSGKYFSGLLSDFRLFFPLLNNTLAVQGLVEMYFDDVPYYLLPEIGGSHRLRGLDHSRRIVDKSVWLVRSELRSHLWWRLGSVVFIETGGAGSHFLSDTGSPIISVGGGLRFRVFPQEKLNIRLDGAISSGGLYGVSLSLKEAF